MENGKYVWRVKTNILGYWLESNRESSSFPETVRLFISDLMFNVLPGVNTLMVL